MLLSCLCQAQKQTQTIQRHLYYAKKINMRTLLESFRRLHFFNLEVVLSMAVIASRSIYRNIRSLKWRSNGIAKSLNLFPLLRCLKSICFAFSFVSSCRICSVNWTRTIQLKARNPCEWMDTFSSRKYYAIFETALYNIWQSTWNS